jgi:PIN domain nuclease of toxin-antitoxin system
MGCREVILLDTHVWVWLVHGDPLLPAGLRAALEVETDGGIGVSIISCWEVAKLVERDRLELPMDTHDWMELALSGSGISMIPLTPSIVIASTTLPGEFHRDPADQMIVATARSLDVPVATCDRRIREYPHVRLLEDSQIHDR